MVSSAELRLRRAMSSGELYGGRDPNSEIVIGTFSSNTGERVLHEEKVSRDQNANIQVNPVVIPRCNSLNQLPGHEDKVHGKSHSGKLWQIFGKRSKRGFSKFLSSATYKIGNSRGGGINSDATDDNDGRFSSASFHTSNSTTEDLSELYSRHTSRDSGFSSEIDSLPSTPASSLNGDRIPGVTGLHNLGNTCYINSVLQCLGHIDSFVEYFATDRHETDTIGKRKGKRIEAQTTSEITDKLARILKSLWSFGYSKEFSREFKEALSNVSEQYKGSMQHDAQEFLLWLLNFVHEDLGKSSKKKSTKTVSVKKRKHYTEEELALMTLAAYTRSSGSFIQDLFQAQYKSSLNCPNCEKHSSTFDPFLCISLPIPQPATKPYYVTVVFHGKQTDALRVGVKVSTTGTVRDLKTEISRVAGIAEENLILMKIEDNGEQECLKETSLSLAAHSPDNMLFAIEKPDLTVLKPPRRPSTGNSATNSVDEPTRNDTELNSVIVIVTNVEVRGHQTRRFANPVALRVSRDVRFRELQLLIRREMRVEIREAFNKEARRSKLAVGLRVVEGTSTKEYLNTDTESPLFLPVVQRGERSSVATGYRHVCLIAEWESVRGEWCFAKFGRGFAKVDRSVQVVDEEHSKTQIVNLKECISLHTQEEELQYEDFWKCPNCKTELQKATKTLSLWSLPDVLVFHLKRFQQQGDYWKGKVSSFVDFPLESLDMSSHVAHRKKLSPRLLRRYSSMKKLRYHPPPKQEDCLYDLVAVCNHVGPYITSGHYTAHCKNSVDGNWYLFDDLIARPVPEDQVLSKNAYLLFYQRRTGLSRASSVASFPMSAKHWSLKMSNPSQRYSLHLDLESSIARLAEQELKCATDR